MERQFWQQRTWRDSGKKKGKEIGEKEKLRQVERKKLRAKICLRKKESERQTTIEREREKVEKEKKQRKESEREYDKRTIFQTRELKKFKEKNFFYCGCHGYKNPTSVIHHPNS